MPLPTKPKKDPKSIPASFRLSERTVKNLQILKEKHNLSKAEIIEYLVDQEMKHLEKKGK